MSRLDDPEYRGELKRFYNWLLDGRELDRIEKIVHRALAKPKPRTSRRRPVLQDRRRPSRSTSGLRITSVDKQPLRSIRAADRQQRSEIPRDRSD